MCDCQSYNGQGVWAGSTPEASLPYGKYFPESGITTVSVDACIAETMERLWVAGVRTGACCCGHNGQSPIANGNPNVMIIDPSQAQTAFDVLASDPRKWWVQLWAGDIPPPAEKDQTNE